MVTNDKQAETADFWACERETVRPVITSRGRPGYRESDTAPSAIEYDPGTVAMRQGMRARPTRVRFEFPAMGRESRE